MSDTAAGLPDHRVCEQARASRDPRFDGVFFIAVTSTRIYCRPTCPVRSPKPENIRYYPSAAAAEAAGFRPCLRCRPELSPSDPWPRSDDIVARALKLIEGGFLVDNPLAALAGRVGVGERQLRRLFVERLGATPIEVHSTRRLLFAKQLLTETSLSILDVALESGFNSVRRFNACFREAYGMTPSTVRRRPRRARVQGQALELRLDYRPPYDFEGMLRLLRSRTLAGIEEVDATSYARAFGPVEAPGWLRVSAWSRKVNALRLELCCQQPSRILEVVTRVRRMFDLDADPQIIAEALADDDELSALVRAHPGTRLPGAWDGFEAAVGSVLTNTGDHSDKGDSMLLLSRFGDPVDLPAPFSTSRLFPTPEALAVADLAEAGIDRRAAATIGVIARSLLDGRVDFDSARTLENFVGRWSSLPGIDQRMAHDIALRALGHPDAFPVGGTPTAAQCDGPRTSDAPPRPLEKTQRWRPWRAYAFIHLMNASVHACGGEVIVRH